MRRRQIGTVCALVVALAGLQACAGILQRGAVTPAASIAMPVGINDGFHGPLPPAVVASYQAVDAAVPIRTPQITADGLDAFVASVAAAPNVLTYALVEGVDPALARAFAQRSAVRWIEVGNELELPPLELSPQAFVDAVVAMHDAIRQVNPTVPVVTGGVYTLNDDTKRRLSLVHAACPDCWIAVHLYEGLAREDLDFLRGLGVPIVVSETGYPTRCEPARLPMQKAWIDEQLRTVSTVANVRLAFVYQRPNGSGCSDLETFGIAGKPAAALIGGR